MKPETNYFNFPSIIVSRWKSGRLQRVEKYISTIKILSATLGLDSSQTITKVHPSLNQLSGLSKNISDCILEKLDSTVKSLESEKQLRLDKVIFFHVHFYSNREQFLPG